MARSLFPPQVGSQWRRRAHWKHTILIKKLTTVIGPTVEIQYMDPRDRSERVLLIDDFAREYEIDDGRAPWPVYFMQIAHLVAQRATCDRKHVGAVLVRERRILATGYNGAAPGDPHCNEIGHDLVTTDGRQNCVRTIHAEQNVIAQAAQFGIPVSGATLYVNTFPCWNVCAKLLLGARIGRVIYDSDYNNDERVLSAFQRAGISLEKFDSTLL
jgi:dCMP deaminase